MEEAGINDGDIICIFNEHNLVKSIFGDEVTEIIQAIAIQKPPRRQLKTMGGESWWNTMLEREGFRIQQHKISKHLRILDNEDYRVYFTYSKSDAMAQFKKYFGEDSEDGFSYVWWLCSKTSFHYLKSFPFKNSIKFKPISVGASKVVKVLSEF
mgnify:CR=1 FL=1